MGAFGSLAPEEDVLLRPPRSPAAPPTAATQKPFREGLWGALAQPFTDAYKAVTGGMTDPEAQDFAFGSAFGSLGPGGAGALKAIFAGIGAKTANHAALGAAKNMALKGAGRDAIWNETGWFRGNDGKWRFEIPDNAASLGPAIRPVPNTGVMQVEVGDPRFGRALDHPDLTQAYPGISQSPVRDTGLNFSIEGGFHPETKAIYMAPREGDKMRSTALHEAQHYIQNEEGFVLGANPNDFRDIALAVGAVDDRQATEAARETYRRIAGETEARNVQTRLNMTPEQRRATPPWQTQDVPDELQIIPKRSFGSLAP